jgi:antitoxin component of MazEF toxin-antitoxin module
MGELIKVRKSNEGLTIVIPKEICERLSIVEGSQIDIEPYNSSGEFGARIKLTK